MREEIDKLMQENQVDAIWVTGAGQDNPAMVYLTGGIEVSHADLFKKLGKPGVLFHSPIERDGAVKAGLSLRNYAEFSFEQLFEEARGDVSLAEALRYKKMFESLELTRGRVAVYGIIDLGIAYNHLSKLKKFFPEIDFDISPEQDVISKARVTKDTQELSRIKRMGVLTTQIVGNIADYLTSHRVKNEVLLLNDDTPLTISDVKRKIRYLLIENNIQANETIFAIGRDAGVPHNNGNPASIIKLGETIIFDAFFQEIGGGYFYDFTRTWCLGYAPDEVQKVHHDVKEVYDQIVKSVRKDIPYYQLHKQSCDLFEEMGYPTIRSQPTTQSGYVHGLGHGLGLEVHESPFANADIPAYVLRPGMAFTIEPGLYYPERGYGVRIEDTYCLDPEGKLASFADYPDDLILSM